MSHPNDLPDDEFELSEDEFDRRYAQGTPVEVVTTIEPPAER